MSLIIGSLEEFVKWNHKGVIFPELLALYEPYRDTIEWWLDQFDDTQSWCDYAGACPVEVPDVDIERVMSIHLW